MDQLDPIPEKGDDSEQADLVRRLARYRLRVRAEGRTRSLRLIDSALDDAAKATSTRPGA